MKRIKVRNVMLSGLIRVSTPSFPTLHVPKTRVCLEVSQICHPCADRLSRLTSPEPESKWFPETNEGPGGGASVNNLFAGSVYSGSGVAPI